MVWIGVGWPLGGLVVKHQPSSIVGLEAGLLLCGEMGSSQAETEGPH